jgi:Raf kinase inhibitor-like YbhB/YbcL family protein
MILTSPRFENNGPIPKEYTCEGVPEDAPHVSPPLEWSGVPPEAQSLFLIVDDADAVEEVPPGSGRYYPHRNKPWVHWVLYNIPPDASGLPAGGRPLPEGTLEGVDIRERRGYRGPCPPDGRPHHYFFKLYAVNWVIDVDRVFRDFNRPRPWPAGLSKADLLAYLPSPMGVRVGSAAYSHRYRTIAGATLVGTYQ